MAPTVVIDSVFAVLDAGGLLLGPRGRGLCLAVAREFDADVSAALHNNDAEALAQVLTDLDCTSVTDWDDPSAFVGPITRSVASAMYWEEPWPEVVLAADTGVVTALRPVAEAIAASPAAAWWSTPVDLGSLRYKGLTDRRGRPTGPPLSGARQGLQTWLAHTLADEREAAVRRPTDPPASYSGYWWSTPALAPLLKTTRSLPGLGSTHLVWEEDDVWRHEDVIWRLTPTRQPRVWEINGPQSWIDLVERYPLDVTHGRKHDWYRVTGLPGPWRIPDWEAVATDWDAVHLSVAGYLTTATRALQLTSTDAGTVLAGWDPDETWWLNDVLALESEQPEIWKHEDVDDGGHGWTEGSR